MVLDVWKMSWSTSVPDGVKPIWIGRLDGEVEGVELGVNVKDMLALLFVSATYSRIRWIGFMVSIGLPNIQTRGK